MATFRKRHKRWTAEVRKQGFYKSKTFDTKIAAQTWAIETEQFLSSEVDLVRGKTFANALDRFEREVSKGRKGECCEVICINNIAGMRSRIDCLRVSPLRISIAGLLNRPRPPAPLTGI